MSKLKFNPTHRVLIVAKTGTHGYDIYTIDENNGTFMKSNVDSKDTKIRSKKGFVAEKLCYNGANDYNRPLKDADISAIADKFNAKRVELGFKPLEFYRLESDNK